MEITKAKTQEARKFTKYVESYEVNTARALCVCACGCVHMRVHPYPGICAQMCTHTRGRRAVLADNSGEVDGRS